MKDVADIQALMERAEQAAPRGDWAAAEEALRLAVELQERTLGASSPEVASTLNNLGIVYERLNRPAEAESCYRKSFAIAKAAFAGDHPLVETSATNLREFCDARGIAFERPDPKRPEPAPVSPPETPTAAAPSRPAREAPPASAVATSSPSSLGQIGLGVAVILAVVAGMFLWSHRAAPPLPSPAPSSAAIPPAPVVEPEATPSPAASPAPVASPPAAVSEPVSKPSAPPVSPQTAPRVAVVEILDARLCRSLNLEENWRCDPLPESAVSGPVFFVTRLKSATDTSVEHRWYRDNRLSQSVTLRVGATGSGYRTYSRMTASPDRSGTWRVEVRAASGAVLDQKTFVVLPP